MRSLINSFLIIVFTALSLTVNAQDCKSISIRKDKVNGIITASGIIQSKDLYHLLIQKQISYDDPSEQPRYIFFLIKLSSKTKFSDSMLRTKGTFYLKLLDNSIVRLEGASFFNRPIGRRSIGVRVYIDKTTIGSLASNPIVAVRINDKLETIFKSKEQKKQQKVFDCLLREDLGLR